jgi:two-component system, NarL family, response regulator DegU
MTDHNRLGVVIADDHPVFRRGLRTIIEDESGFEVVGEANDGEDALALIEKTQPAIAILDISMPKLDGLEIANRLRELGSSVKIIFNTMYREEKLFKKALDAGVKGYVLKDCAAVDIVSCLNAVAGGQNYTSPELTTYLMNRVREVESQSTAHSGLETLTDTERKVLTLIADCKTNKEIAQELFVSARTVETHRNNICKKLNIHGSHALMKFALDHQNQLSRAH